jgi:hypothetical protein
LIGAFFNGIIGFVAILFAIVIFAQHPGIFWGVVAAFVFIVALAFITTLMKRDFSQPKGRGPGNLRLVPDDDEEGDIRHHHDFGGNLHDISDSRTIQNQVFDNEDEER